ncbi:MAG: DUF885 domain-containing protein, partial [Verrucomicrobiota bacterium]|nr:DUF885 domain-containing protein [Verrucomicrobiota bacterium]
MNSFKLFVVVLLIAAAGNASAQTRGASPSTARNPDGRANAPDVTNKGLITKTTGPELMASAALHQWADDYYAWQNESFPVSSSEAGLHTWDDRLTDFAPAKIAEREKHVRVLLDKVRAMKIDNWPKDERIDALLFRSQLEQFDFARRVLKPTETNPQVYIGEC